MKANYFSDRKILCNENGCLGTWGVPFPWRGVSSEKELSGVSKRDPLIERRFILPLSASMVPLDSESNAQNINSE